MRKLDDDRTTEIARTADMNSRLLKPAEIAEVLGVSLKTIYKWTHLGQIPVARAGRLLRFDEDDVVKWAKREVTSAKQAQPQPGPKRGNAGISSVQKRRGHSEVNSIVKSAISEVLD